jgi:hypothetical protein
MHLRALFETRMRCFVTHIAIKGVCYCLMPCHLSMVKFIWIVHLRFSKHFIFSLSKMNLYILAHCYKPRAVCAWLVNWGLGRGVAWLDVMRSSLPSWDHRQPADTSTVVVWTSGEFFFCKNKLVGLLTTSRIPVRCHGLRFFLATSIDEIHMKFDSPIF